MNTTKQKILPFDRIFVLVAPPVGLEPRPFATSIQLRRQAAYFIVLRHHLRAPCFVHRTRSLLGPLRPQAARRLVGSVQSKKAKQKVRKSVPFVLAPPVGLEPTTLRLTAACSTD